MRYNSYSLKQLVNACLNFKGTKKDKAWEEFFRRFQKPICYYVGVSCNKWNYKNLYIPKSELVKDSISGVFMILTTKLDTFKHLDSEYRFLAWLQVVCNRVVARQIENICTYQIYHHQTNDLSHFAKANEPVFIEEIFESMVDQLRSNLTESNNADRYINIFLLFSWMGFKAKSIRKLPFYKHLKQNSLEIIIFRLRKILQSE